MLTNFWILRLQTVALFYYIPKHFIGPTVTACHICKFPLIPFSLHHHSRKHLDGRKKINTKYSTRFFSPAQSHVSESKRGFPWRRAAIPHPVGAIVWSHTAGTAKESVWSLRASCNGTVALRWVIGNDMHRCSCGSVAGSQYNRLPSMNLSHRAFPTNFPQPDDARPASPPVNREGSQKLYYSLSFSQEDTWGPSGKRVCHLAGRVSLYGCPISPGNKSPRH